MESSSCRPHHSTFLIETYRKAYIFELEIKKQMISLKLLVKDMKIIVISNEFIENLKKSMNPKAFKANQLKKHRFSLKSKANP